MKSSKSKRQLTTEDICREYFESQIFEKIIDGNYLSVEFFVDAFANIAVADQSFKAIDTNLLDRELIALNIELFGLAWWHHNFEMVNKDKRHPFSESICKEIVFTKSYMMQNGLQDIWDAMAFYNESMFRAYGKWALWDSWSRLRDIPPTVREGDKEGVILKFAEAKLDIFKDIFRKEYEWLDEDCRQSLEYRFITANRWKDGVMMSQELTLALLSKLGCRLNNEALFVLHDVIVGLYDNAVNYLDAVREWGSYEAAKDARRALLEGLKTAVRKRE